MRRAPRLRTLGIALTLGAFLTAWLAAWLWFSSTQNWTRHLTRAFTTGVTLYDALRQGLPPPAGVSAQVLPEHLAAMADRGEFAQLPGRPMPSFVTNVSLLDHGRDRLSGTVLTLAILSDQLQYSVAQIASAEGQSAAQKLGNVTRLMASYCSEPILYARMGDGIWRRIDGTAIWGCDAAPRDLRLLAVLIAVVALAVALSLVAETSSQFNRFARALQERRRLGGPESYSVDGPEELREIVAAVNSYLEVERARLANRATVLSGISHDLGTPATRLRLRSALIQDDDLRQKLEADIDSMTGMIESVLTYTRSEMNAEAPRRLSLTSLIEALVADYQDMGQPVDLRAAKPRVIEGAGSLFSAQRGQGALPERQDLPITARPVSLQRAVSNLVDNALKYGRRALVGVSADARHVTITVEDEGSDMSPDDIEKVIAPFKRGAGNERINGFGLGLTIVATVAEQHGGRLYFDQGGTGGGKGLRACLEIPRGV